MPSSLFAQPLFKFFLVYLWVWTLHFKLNTFHRQIIVFSQCIPIPLQPVLLKYQDYDLYSQSVSPLLGICIFYHNVIHQFEHLIFAF